MTDKLYDVLHDIPGFAHRVTVLPYTVPEEWGLRAELASLQARLATWREEWQTCNSNSARLVERAQTHQSHSLPVIDSFLSVGLRFHTTEQAVEMLHYNAAMLYLSQLQLILDGESPDPQAVMSSMESEVDNIPAMGNLGVAPPLLPPGEVQFPWQYWIEGLRIAATIRGDLSVSTHVYVSFAPIALLYCFARRLGVHHIMLPMISREEWAEDAEGELGVYDLFAPVPYIARPSIGSGEARSGEQDISGSYDKSDGRELFVKSAT